MKMNIVTRLHSVKDAVAIILDTLEPVVRTTVRYQWRIEMGHYDFEAHAENILVSLHVEFGQKTPPFSAPPEPLKSALCPTHGELPIQRSSWEIDELIRKRKWQHGGGESSEWYCRRAIMLPILLSELPDNIVRQRKELEKRWKSFKEVRKAVSRSSSSVMQKLRNSGADKAGYINVLRKWATEIEHARTQVTEILTTACADTFAADLEKHKTDITKALGLTAVDEVVWVIDL